MKLHFWHHHAEASNLCKSASWVQTKILIGLGYNWITLKQNINQFNWRTPYEVCWNSTPNFLPIMLTKLRHWTDVHQNGQVKHSRESWP